MVSIQPLPPVQRCLEPIRRCAVWAAVVSVVSGLVACGAASSVRFTRVDRFDVEPIAAGSPQAADGSEALLRFRLSKTTTCDTYETVDNDSIPPEGGAQNLLVALNARGAERRVSSEVCEVGPVAGARVDLRSRYSGFQVDLGSTAPDGAFDVPLTALLELIASTRSTDLAFSASGFALNGSGPFQGLAGPLKSAVARYLDMTRDLVEEGRLPNREDFRRYLAEPAAGPDELPFRRAVQARLDAPE